VSLRQLRQTRSPYRPDRVAGVLPGITYVAQAAFVAPGTTLTTTSITFDADDDVREGDLIVLQFVRVSTGAFESVTSDGMTFSTGFDSGTTIYVPNIYFGIVSADGPRQVDVNFSVATRIGVQAIVVRSSTGALDVAMPGSTSFMAAGTTLTFPTFDTNTDGAGAFMALVLSDDNNPSVPTAGWDASTMDDIANASAVLAFKQTPTAGATGTMDVLLNVSPPDSAVYLQFAFKPITA
jgi:hypothetical protein